MLKFLRTIALSAACLALWFAAAAAQPNPADSVIIESKTVAPFDSACSRAGLLVRVFITNKDTLSNITLPFESRTLTSAAYATLSRGAACSGTRTSAQVFPFLYPPALSGTQRLGTRVANFLGYHSNPPDSFMFTGTFDPTDPDTWMPRNPTRAALIDIKFDTAKVTPLTNGQFEIDSVRIPPANTIQFVDPNGATIRVNFVKSLVTVQGLGVKDIDKGQIPTVYSLAQNYPNPFNANTQITFALPKSGQARLDIYNVLGQKVSTLFNEFMSAGTKTVNWDGRDDRGVGVPSGVYFYRLSSLDFLQTKKMLLIK
jgi:hypothetical protein